MHYSEFIEMYDVKVHIDEKKTLFFAYPLHLLSDAIYMNIFISYET